MRLLITVVVYNKKISEIKWLSDAVLEGNIFVYFYDNSVQKQKSPLEAKSGFYYEYDSANSGVSRAYNMAVLRAKELNCDKLLILDQDTDFDMQMLTKYEELYMKYGNHFIYAPIVKSVFGDKIYSPANMNRFVGTVQSNDEFEFSEVYSLKGKSVINSGLMIPLQVLEKTGGYNEKLKLDFSDIYFIEKYKDLVSDSIVLVDVVLVHSLSGDEGLSLQKELTRFKFYCYGARELGRSLGKRVIWSPVRRLLRLVQKYKSLNFFKVFWSYYIRGKEI